MSFLSIEVKGLGELQSYIANLNKGQRNVIKQEFKEAGNEIVNKMKRDVPVDQARLKNSISFLMNGDTDLEIVAQTSYAPFMEFGTKGKFSASQEIQGYASTFKNYKGDGSVKVIDALTNWVRRKGIVSTYSIKTKKRSNRTNAEGQREKKAAWAIFWSIKHYGVKPQPFFFRTATGQSRIIEIQKTIAKRLETGIKSLIGD